MRVKPASFLAGNRQPGPRFNDSAACRRREVCQTSTSDDLKSGGPGGRRHTEKRTHSERESMCKSRHPRRPGDGTIVGRTAAQPTRTNNVYRSCLGRVRQLRGLHDPKKSGSEGKRRMGWVDTCEMVARGMPRAEMSHRRRCVGI